MLDLPALGHGADPGLLGSSGPSAARSAPPDSRPSSTASPARPAKTSSSTTRASSSSSVNLLLYRSLQQPTLQYRLLLRRRTARLSTASGTYYVLVDGESTSSVNYQFRLTDTSTNSLTFNTTINGTVTNAYQSDVYSFTGTAGEHVYFQYLSESNGYYGATWYLYGPNNRPITSSYTGAGFSATLPTNGNYTLVVDNNSYSTATYSFEAFQNVNPTSA